MAPELTWADVRAALQRAAQDASEWAGYPLPVSGLSMQVHKSYPFAERLGEVFQPEESLRICRNEDVDESGEIRNEWSSYRDGKPLVIWRDRTGFHFSYGRRIHTGPMLLDTLKASRAWDIGAELRALETLRHHISCQQFEDYFMTGMFLESSKKSGVFYLFRRLRPTIAMTGRPNKHGKDVGLRILACLCAHPIAYYTGTFAGAMVPSDDVLSHLLLARSDEHLLWKQCNQHHPLAPEAGL